MKQPLLLIALVFLMCSCAALEEMFKEKISEPEVSYKTIKVSKLDSEGLELQPVFSIYNGNAFTIPVDKLSYQLAFNQQRMLDGKTSKIGDLSANATKDIGLNLKLNKEVLESFKELLTNNKKLDYLIKGHVEVVGFKIPFERQGSLYRPEISMGGVRIVNASYKKLDLELDLLITNQNDFELPLENISYQLSSKGKDLLNGSLSQQKIAKGENRIRLPISIKPSEIFGSVFSLIQKPELPLTLVIDSPLQSIEKTETLNLKGLLSR